MAQDTQKKAQILFVLSENVRPSLELGLIGHLREMKDIPPVGSIFLIADSLRGMVLGPFVVTANQFYRAEPVIFQRRVVGTQTEDAYCHWLFSFAKHPSFGGYERALTHREAAWVAKLPFDWWRDARHLHMTDEQFQELCGALSVATNSDNKTSGMVDYNTIYPNTSNSLPEFIYDEAIEGRFGLDGDDLAEQDFLDAFYSKDRDIDKDE